MTLETLIIDSFSIAVFFSAIAIMFYILIDRLKGMQKPPFWIYILGGFIAITLHDVLATLSLPLFQPSLVSAIRLVGNLLVLYGVYKLLKSFTSNIKYDKKIPS